MATTFKNVVSASLGTDPIIVYTAAGNVRVTVLGISLANLTAGFVTASVYITDPAPTGTFTANQSLRVINGGERLVLGSSNSLVLITNTPASCDVIVSLVEIV